MVNPHSSRNIEGSVEGSFYIQKENKRGKNIQAIRGMNDYLPGETAIWQRIEGTLKTCSAATVTVKSACRL